jgi:hypothetical protein
MKSANDSIPAASRAGRQERLANIVDKTLGY